MCDDICSFVDYGFELVQEGGIRLNNVVSVRNVTSLRQTFADHDNKNFLPFSAKTTRMLTEAHAAELLESDDPTLQVVLNYAPPIHPLQPIVVVTNDYPSCSIASQI